MSNPMRVDIIDHVHIEVADRDVSAAWYARVLGLEPYEPLAAWARTPGGPLILATPGGTPVLSLFARSSKARSRDSTIAFRVSGAAFLAFLEDLPSLNLPPRMGRALQAGDIVDHGPSWSMYFHDPDDNPIELTTYDHDVVADGRARRGRPETAPSRDQASRP